MPSRQDNTIATDAQEPAPTYIAIPKNKSQEFRVSLEDFKGHAFVNVRVWYRDKDDDEMRPGRQGVAVNLDKARSLAEAIMTLAGGHPEASNELRLHGLLRHILIR